MNSKMSFNDRERLKKDIRARLAVAKMQIKDTLQVEDVIQGQGMPVSKVPLPHVFPAKQTTQKKQIKPQNNNVPDNRSDLRAMQGQPHMSGIQDISVRGGTSAMYVENMQTVQEQQNNQEVNDEFNNKFNNEFDNKPEFERYDCGHPYPPMTVGEHIKKDMRSGYRQRISNLQYAFVMSEILSEPLSKRKRRNKKRI